MACTTLLVGKKASWDGATITARNEDSPSGQFTEKKLVIVKPDDQPRRYRSVLSHVEIDLPENPMRYSAMPDALGKEGIWAAAGVNEANVSMTATETITSNERVLGADPLVRYRAASEQEPEQAGGIGEEDMVTLVLPYIRSAKEGVVRLGSLLETYGTYEMNGIAFQDEHEIWWLETIGGHHWIARRVPDDCYVVMPNQLGIDVFDLEDAFGEQREHMCSADLRDWIERYHLGMYQNGKLNARWSFGSATDSDHVYNTPRAWYMLRFFHAEDFLNAEERAVLFPESDCLPWCSPVTKPITIEDVKYVLSSHYQGTPFDPYGTYVDPVRKGKYRSIGVNRNNFLSVVQINEQSETLTKAIEWLTFGSNVFNALVPFFPQTEKVPAYFAATGAEVSTESFYWNNRLIAALADADFSDSQPWIERYQLAVHSEGHRLINRRLASGNHSMEENEAVNEEVAEMVRKQTSDLLLRILYVRSMHMKNAYSRSDS